MDKIIITQSGQALLAKMTAGETTAEFTKFCTSSAEYLETELSGLTALKDTCQTSEVTNMTVKEDHTVVLSGAIDNGSLQSGYYITAIGLFAQGAGEDEILYAVCKLSSPVYMPEMSGTLSGMSIRFSVKVDNAESIVVNIDDTTAATVGDLQDLKDEVQAPVFEDYEGEGTVLPDMDTALGQIQSGKGIATLIQYIKAALKILDEREVDMSEYDQAIQELIEMDDQQNEDIGNLQDQMQSFENTKSDIVSSSLGQVIGLTVSNTWAQIVEKIKAVVNRGTLNWSGSNTTYDVPAGYYSGGTLDSRPSYNNGYNAGVSAADNRVNTNSQSYKSGYNAGVSAKTPKIASGSKKWARGEFLNLGFQPNIFIFCGPNGDQPTGIYCNYNGVSINVIRGTSNSTYRDVFYTNGSGIGLNDVAINYAANRDTVYLAIRIV